MSLTWGENGSVKLVFEPSRSVSQTSANDSSEQNWLLIFDNIERWELLAHYLPVDLPTTHGSVLVTTQVEDIANLGTSNVLMQPFDIDEGATMLLDRIQEGSPGEDRDINWPKKY